MAVFSRTKEELCSAAFTLLGAGQITGFDDGSDLGKIAGLLYSAVRDRVLIMHPWKCAIRKSASLSRHTATPKNEWRYKYQLPSEMLAGPKAVFDSDSSGATPIADFEVFEKQEIYSNADALYVDYWIRPDINTWPPYLYQLMMFALAADFAEPATDQTSKADYWRAVAFGTPSEGGTGGYFRQARTLDAQTQQVKAFRDDYPLISARY